MMKKLILYILFVFAAEWLMAQDVSLRGLLQGCDVEVEEIETNDFFYQGFKMVVQQPLDHKKDSSVCFNQRAFLFHRGYDRPVVMVTEGYDAEYANNSQYIHELCRYLDANLVVIEHRYFGESMPQNCDWHYLNIEQAAGDHHRIRGLLKNVYPGKWVATGISKGGQTSLYYRYFFPHDVDATIAYVAPINFSAEDPREISHLQTVGDDECRGAIFDFQVRAFEKKDLLVERLNKFVKEMGIELILPVPVVVDYLILEFPFSFWQYHDDCSVFKDKYAADEIFNVLKEVVSLYTYSMKGYQKLGAFFYQAFHELGYYGYDESPFRAWLTWYDYPNWVFMPQGTMPDFDASAMQNVNAWLQYHGNNIVYLYGERDPWSASAVMLSEGRTNALKIMKPLGHHGTRIRNLQAPQKQQVLDSLKRWLNIEKVK